jgi:ABC-type spermidine/putrescine transport system permease subunit I
LAVAGETTSVTPVPGGDASQPGAGRTGRLVEYAGFAPAIILFGGFFLVPMVLIVLYSFWETIDYNVVHNWTLDNYHYFLSVPTYVRTLWATIWMAAVATFLTIAAAFPFAYWLARHVPRHIQRPMLLLVILPFWASYLLRVYAWITILGEKGVINRLLIDAGIIDHPLSFLLYNRTAVIVVLTYLYFPFAALTLFAALERFDWSLLTAAMDLGAPPLTAIRRILLPQIRAGITTAVIFVFIPVLGEYLTPQLVGGTKGVMIGNLIVNFFQGAEYTRGAAASILIAAMIVALLVLFRRSIDVEDVYAR